VVEVSYIGLYGHIVVVYHRCTPNELTALLEYCIIQLGEVVTFGQNFSMEYHIRLWHNDIPLELIVPKADVVTGLKGCDVIEIHGVTSLFLDLNKPIIEHSNHAVQVLYIGLFDDIGFTDL